MTIWQFVLGEVLTVALAAGGWWVSYNLQRRLEKERYAKQLGVDAAYQMIQLVERFRDEVFILHEWLTRLRPALSEGASGKGVLRQEYRDPPSRLGALVESVAKAFLALVRLFEGRHVILSDLQRQIDRLRECWHTVKELQAALVGLMTQSAQSNIYGETLWSVEASSLESHVEPLRCTAFQAVRYASDLIKELQDKFLRDLFR